MRKSEYKFIFLSFIIWRIGTLVFAYLGSRFLPLFSHNFLGGGLKNYVENPLFWGNLNFDGEHYLALAQNGYKPLTYFYFPIYPLLIKTFAFIKTEEILAWTGLIISNLAFLVTLIGVYKLIKLDFKDKIAKLTIVLLLIFPTSFYFGAYYTESIFLLLIVWSFYAVRKGNFLVAAILAGVASATRVIGIVMFPVLIMEFFFQKRRDFGGFLAIFLSPLGLLTYMLFLLKQTGDALNFLTTVYIFGTQRSSNLILLPQVIYRYIFKILPVINYGNFFSVFTTYLEIGCGLLFLLLIIYSFFKLRWSYSLYAIFAYLIPTFSGSFSSMPRYVLVVFPCFIALALVLSKQKSVYRYGIFLISIILLGVATAMFFRGYWIS